MVKSKLDKSLQTDIIKRISGNFKIKKMVLFGSYANGDPDAESDIDLLVILDEGGISQNYWEKVERRMKVSRVLADIKKQISIDMLVYTKDEWELMIHNKNSFISDVMENGVNLI